MYSQADAKSAFTQLMVGAEFRPKLSFWGADASGRVRLLQYRRMAMGLKNASPAWQQVLDEALGDLPFVAVYADDICIFSGEPWMTEEEVFQQHCEHLRIVFQRLAERHVSMAPKKCRLACTQIPFLGHMIGQDGVWPQHDKVEAVRKMAAPKDKGALRRFLGRVNY